MKTINVAAGICWRRFSSPSHGNQERKYNHQHFRFLVQQRPAGRSQAGLWELPGGKLEPTETYRQALVRELSEELGIKISDSRLHPTTLSVTDQQSFWNEMGDYDPPPIRACGTITHQYGAKASSNQEPFQVVLRLFHVMQWQGTPQGKEGQSVDWIPSLYNIDKQKQQQQQQQQQSLTGERITSSTDNDVYNSTSINKMLQGKTFLEADTKLIQDLIKFGPTYQC